MKKNKMKISVFNAISSITIGVGSAYLTSDYVIANCDKDNVSIVIALIAITSDKIGEFLIYKLNIEGLIKSIIDSLILGIKK